MLDELPFESDNEQPRRHRRKQGGRSAMTLLLVVVLLGAVGLGGWWGFDKIKGFFGAEDFEGTGNGEYVSVEVVDGDTIADIGNSLYREGVVASARAFVDAAAENPAAQGIQPGTYRLQKEMSAASVVTAMTDGSAKGFPQLTIHDGLEFWAVYESLEASTGIPAEEFEQAGSDPSVFGIPDEWFMRNDGKKVSGTIEGFLLPDSYQFDGGSTAHDILQTMVDNFLAYTTEIDFVGKAGALNENVSPYEALIVASLVDAEAGVPDDFGKVARVAYNRVFADEHWCNGDLLNCLEFDSTTNYGNQIKGGEKKDSDDLSDDELRDPDNEYSTHVYAGLPPGPINSPGKAALDAAANPADGDWLYFVAVDKEGNSKFAHTYDEHRINIEEACANKVLTC